MACVVHEHTSRFRPLRRRGVPWQPRRSSTFIPVQGPGGLTAFTAGLYGNPDSARGGRDRDRFRDGLSTDCTSTTAAATSTRPTLRRAERGHREPLVRSSRTWAGQQLRYRPELTLPPSGRRWSPGRSAATIPRLATRSLAKGTSRRSSHRRRGRSVGYLIVVLPPAASSLPRSRTVKQTSMLCDEGARRSVPSPCSSTSGRPRRQYRRETPSRLCNFRLYALAGLEGRQQQLNFVNRWPLHRILGWMRNFHSNSTLDVRRRVDSLGVRL